MLDPALFKLMRLQARGVLRRLGRGARTARGAAFFLFGLVIFVSWLASVIMTARGARPTPAHVRAVVPLMLLGVCLMSALTSAGDKAVAFTPGEVDFLFPGPFRRRELLYYKLTKSAFAAALSSLILSFALLRYATLWAACCVGIFLTLLFIQFLSTALLLAGQTATERAYSRGRRLALALIVGLVVLGMHGALAGRRLSGPGAIDITELLERFARAGPGRVVLAPFNVYGQAITAQHLFPDLLKWAAVAVAINAVLLAVVVRLDANYLEAAAGASQRRHEKLRRFRSGGAMGMAARGTARRHLPPFPRLLGVGPIAWRQLTHAGRSAKGLLVVLAVLAGACGPVFLASRQPRGGSEMSPGALLSTMAWFSVLLASVMKFDFRGDLDAMETLKALPLRPWAIAVGELVAPVLVMTAVHLLLLGAVATTFHLTAADRAVLVAAALLALPFNLLLFAAENLVFLMLPSRPATTGPGDFQILGRQMFTLAMRTVIVAIGAAVAGVIAMTAYHVFGKSMAALTVAAGAMLLAEGAMLVPLIAWAFDRFDPSVHTPA